MSRELHISHTLLKISLFIFKASPASQKSETILQLTRRAHLVNRRSCKRRQTTNELVRQTTRSEQRDQTSGPLAHPVNCLSPIIERYSVPERSVLSLQFVHYHGSEGKRLQNVHVVLVCNLIGSAAPEVDSFLCECYQALSSPLF